MKNGIVGMREPTQEEMNQRLRAMERGKGLTPEEAVTSACVYLKVSHVGN